MVETHSDKALTTMQLMGTTWRAWVLTPIEWVEEEREVLGNVRCPDCRGNKLVKLDTDGKIVPMPDSDRDSYAWQTYMREAREQRGMARRYDGCPTCCVSRRGYRVSIGTVKGLVRQRILVGYPQFPAGTVFDSRFARSGSRCQLCNKAILKSGRVPVHATVNGTTHGMFVGEDCAKKFLGVKIKREATSIMEDPR
jgi:uncharacterized protein with PIN domain